jgi:NAD+ synthase
VPDEVVDKKPSADLWPGQTDEGDFGFDYATADEVLYLIFDQGSPPRGRAARYPIEIVQKITRLERQNRFKRG